MKIQKQATAGTLESSDCMILIEPSDSPQNELEIHSIVLEQYGEDIRSAANAVLERLGAEYARVTIHDRGAFDCVIDARMETALLRASEGGM